MLERKVGKKRSCKKERVLEEKVAKKGSCQEEMVLEENVNKRREAIKNRGC